MKKLSCTVLAILSLVGATRAGFAEELRALKDQYVVEWNRDSTAIRAAGVRIHSAAMRPLSSFSSVSTIEVGTDGSIRAPSSGAEVVSVSQDAPVCKQLVEQGLVRSCSPNYQMHLLRVPNEDGFSGQYWHRSIGSERAWDVTTGSDNVVVAVLDSGVDYTHPDLADNMWRNPGEIPGNGLDDDANGVVDDVVGYNAEASSGNPMDDNEHGTHVAGIIGARGDNGIGVAGVAWRTKIMALKFIRAEGYGFLSDAIKSLDYMVAMKRRGVPVRVVNNSWGGGGFSQVLEDAIQRVHDAGIIFVAAAGNSGSDNDVLAQFPANYQVPNVVSVAASEEHDQLTGFSCFGHETVHIAAPGNFIKSTVPKGQYAPMSGTSMATPFVTGALGLLLSREPGLSMEQAIARLYRTAEPKSGLEGETVTGRLLNVGNLLANTTPAEPAAENLCSYSARAIPFAPPSGLDAVDPVMPKQKTGFAENLTVDLPFAFPLYGLKSSLMTVGINGIVYFDEALDPWIFKGSGYPPAFSIAALHAPLFDYMLSQPHGVRVQKSSTRVDVSWSLIHPWNPEAGELTFYLSIFPDGSIETHYSIASDRVARTLLYGSVVGLRGQSIRNSTIMSFNGFPTVIRGQMGFRFERPASCETTREIAPTPSPTATPTPIQTPGGTPSPGATPTPGATPAPEYKDQPSSLFEIEEVSISNMKDGKRGVIQAGRTFKLNFAGGSEQRALVDIALNGLACKSAATVSYAGNHQSYAVKLPRLGRKYRLLTLSVGTALDSASIKSKRVNQSKTKRFQAACTAVAKAVEKAK